MKIYQIAGKSYAVIGEDVYERIEAGTIAARPTDTLADLAPEKPARKKYGSGKVKKQKKAGHGTTHCKICDGYGHFAKTCPKRAGGLSSDEVEEEARRPEVTKEQVDELKAKGMNSIQIAAKLRTTLSEINKHW